MNLEQYLLELTGAKSVEAGEIIQSLWSGYGKIQRWYFSEHIRQSIVVKHINLKQGASHPRGWNTNLGHQRKLRSYAVECNWYENYAGKTNELCRIPNCLGIQKSTDEIILVLEDLDTAGFPERMSSLNLKQVKSCLSWLANFHASFLHEDPKDLWPIGTYWHLDTRPEELDSLDDLELKKYASEIDRVLNNCRFKTIVHGDAKLANFCFSENGNQVSSVDFQYVGGGCGMKDVAYFLGSCLSENECEQHEKELLEHYFSVLKSGIEKQAEEVELEWRKIYAYAWTDFHRFLKGWSPGHWKLNSYSEKMTQKVLGEIKSKELSNSVLQELGEVAQRAASLAGKYISDQSTKKHSILEKKGGSTLSSQVLTEVDLKAQEIILEQLTESAKKYDFAILSEELPDDQSRLQKEFFWCVDPLDGTLPFTEGREGFAVSIALVSKSGESLIGVVYDPWNQNLYCSIKGHGVLKNGKSWVPIESTSTFTFCVNRSFLGKPEHAKILSKVQNIAKGKRLVEKKSGGSVMNAIWALEGKPGLYVVLPKKENGGGSIWDFAATVCIYNELNLMAKNALGNSIRLNDPNTTFMNEQGVVFSSDKMAFADLSFY